MSDASVSAPPHSEVRSPLSDGQWHRLHPLTPLLRGGLFLIVIIGIVVANLRERLLAWIFPDFSGDGSGRGLPPDPVDYLVRNNLLLVAGLLLLGTLVILLVAFHLSWRFHTLRITGDDVEVRSGVLFRTYRRSPLDRVQGVNLTRPLVARLLGMAKLEVVGAGTDGNVKLEYLSTANAETVRSDILRLASGRRLADRQAAVAGEQGSSTAASVVGAGITGLIRGDDQDAVQPESVVRIPLTRLIASQLLSVSMLLLVAIVVVVAAALTVDAAWLLLALAPAALGFGGYVVRVIVRSLRYSIAPTPSGVRVTFGLFTTVSEIIPPGRVHAVEIRQGPLWRPFGWWSVTINRLTGRSMTSGADPFTTVLPVGTREDVERVLGLMLAAFPADQWPYVVDHGILGPQENDPYRTTPRRARLLRLLSWRRNGFLLTDHAFFLRRGFLWRTLGIVPLARMQSIGVQQGPLERVLGVADLTAHAVPGSVTTRLGAVDRDEALTAFEQAARGIVAASADDRSHRWAR